jgi:hypothetical protein
MHAVLRNVDQWKRNVEFAAVDHNVADQQAAAKSASNSSSASQSTGSGVTSSATAAKAKLPYEQWSAGPELQAALKAAGLPPLWDNLFADIDTTAISAAAIKLQEKEPTATGKSVEVKLVHPCVADVLKKFFEALHKDTDLAPLLKEVWLYLYIEKTSGKHQKLPRLPDGGFLARTASTPGYVFDETTSPWMLVSVENKRSFASAAGLGAYNDAVNGVQRDYACTLTLPCESMPYGLGVISDGRTYRLVRTEMSPIVKSVWSREFEFVDPDEVKEFLTLLAHAVILAAKRCYVHHYELPKCVLGGKTIQVRAVLASSKNSIVFRFTLGVEKLVGKLVLGDDAFERIKREQAVWREHGTLLAACECFVRRASLPVPSEKLWRSVGVIVFTDDGATPLRDVRKHLVQPRPGEDTTARTARLEQLMDVVVRDVSTALKHLHSHKLAFVDVHPGQIVVQTDADGKPQAARLVDVETVQPFETSVPTKRRVWCARNFEPRQMAKRPVGIETDVESFALTLAWLSSGTESDDKPACLKAVDTTTFNSIAFVGADGAAIRKHLMLWQWPEKWD